MKFKRDTEENISDPYRYLGMHVIHQAFKDKDRKWLEHGESLSFWASVADINEDLLRETVKYKFPEEVVWSAI